MTRSCFKTGCWISLARNDPAFHRMPSSSVPHLYPVHRHRGREQAGSRSGIEFLSLDSRPFKLLGRASCPLCTDFSPEAGVFPPGRDSYTNIRPLMSGGGNASRSMRSRIAAHNLCATATSA